VGDVPEAGRGEITGAELADAVAVFRGQACERNGMIAALTAVGLYDPQVLGFALNAFWSERHYARPPADVSRLVRAALLAARAWHTRRAGETFTADGVIAHRQAPAQPDPESQCLCCRPYGHVYWKGIELPGQPDAPGTDGPVPAQPRDWLSTILHPYRFDRGRRVRLTLEILPADEP
jgi:hypothetical protein